MKKILLAAAAACVLSAPVALNAAEEVHIPKEKWSFNGVLGSFDKQQVQRGFQVYKEVCSACHAMKFVAYRNLADLGYTADEIKSLAAEYTVTDGPNDDGEMFDRPATPADRFKSPFKNDKAARAANGGALPPDMSLLVKAREGGEDYIYSILTGYEEPPADVTLMPGLNYNKAFPGHQIAMAKPLNDGQVAYSDGTPNNLDQEARDVAHFLAWTAEPHMEARKQMGLKVMIFLLVFAGILLRAKRKVWSNLH